VYSDGSIPKEEKAAFKNMSVLQCLVMTLYI